MSETEILAVVRISLKQPTVGIRQLSGGKSPDLDADQSTKRNSESHMIMEINLHFSGGWP
jgi:hypothetical protein